MSEAPQRRCASGDAARSRDGHNEKGRSCVDAKHTGICERITSHCLHDGSRQPQRPADHERGERARNTQLRHHLRVLTDAAAHERVPHHVGSDLTRTEGEGGKGDEGKHQRRHCTSNGDAGDATCRHVRSSTRIV